MAKIGVNFINIIVNNKLKIALTVLDNSIETVIELTDAQAIELHNTLLWCICEVEQTKRKYNGVVH